MNPPSTRAAREPSMGSRVMSKLSSMMGSKARADAPAVLVHKAGAAEHAKSQPKPATGLSRSGRADGLTPLMAAVVGRQPAVARALLAHSDPKAACPKGNTALMLAAATGSELFVHMLLRLSDARALNKLGNAALGLAAARGDALLARLLLPHSEPNHQNALGDTPLMMALAGGFGHCARILAPATDLAARNRDGKDAWDLADESYRRANLQALLYPHLGRSLPGYELRAAARVRAATIVERLAAHHARDADRDGNTALMAAASMGWSEGVALLLPHSDAGAENRRRETAWILAARGGHADCLTTLLEAAWPIRHESLAMGIDGAALAASIACVEAISAACPMVKVSVGAMRAVADDGSSALFEALIEFADASPSARAPSREPRATGPTLLMLAAGQGWTSAVKRLLRTSDPFLRDAHGASALIRAVEVGSQSCVDLLAGVSDLSQRDDRGFRAQDLDGGSKMLEAALARYEQIELSDISVASVKTARRAAL